MNRRGRPPHPDVLTPREWEVLALLREELTDQAIADRLGISLDGAKYHVREILSKLSVGSRQEAAAWQPVAAAPARRWAVLSLALRVAGALVVVAAVGGLGLLAWGVLRTADGGDGVQQSFPSPTPIHEGGPGGSVWEPTGDYQADHDGISLTILWFIIQTNVLVEYSLSHIDLSTTVAPGDLRLADDSEAVYAVRHHAMQGQALGVTVWQTSFDRPPDAGETLSFTLTNPLVKAAQGENTVPGSWTLRFIRNADPDHGPGYYEGVRIAPEETVTHGASVLYGAGSTRITRNGEQVDIPW